MNELEAKYRACQQIGTQASETLQRLARSVLDENRKLRSLLHFHGIPIQDNDAETVGIELEIALDKQHSCEGDDVLLPMITDLHGSSSDFDELDYPVLQEAQRGMSTPLPAIVPEPPMTDMTSIQPDVELLVAAGRVGALHNEQLSIPAGIDDMELLHHGSSGRESVVIDSIPTIHHYQPHPVGLTTPCSDAVQLLANSYPHLNHVMSRDMGCSNDIASCNIRNTDMFELMDKYDAS